MTEDTKQQQLPLPPLGGPHEPVQEQQEQLTGQQPDDAGQQQLPQTQSSGALASNAVEEPSLSGTERALVALVPDVPAMAMGADIPTGALFNKTRMQIRQSATMKVRSQSDAPPSTRTLNDGFGSKLSRFHRPATLAVGGLKVDDYLTSLLPSGAGFGATAPTPHLGPFASAANKPLELEDRPYAGSAAGSAAASHAPTAAQTLSAALSGLLTGRATGQLSGRLSGQAAGSLNTTHRVEPDRAMSNLLRTSRGSLNSRMSAKDTMLVVEEAAAGDPATGLITSTATADETAGAVPTAGAVAGTAGDAGVAAVAGAENAAGLAGVVAGESPRDSDPYDPELLATWHFEQVTADGGVALAFGDLEKVADSADLDRLHEALDQLIEEQAAPIQLEEQVERDLAALSDMHASLRGGESSAEIAQLVAQLAAARASQPELMDERLPLEGIQEDDRDGGQAGAETDMAQPDLEVPLLLTAGSGPPDSPGGMPDSTATTAVTTAVTTAATTAASGVPDAGAASTLTSAGSGKPESSTTPGMTSVLSGRLSRGQDVITPSASPAHGGTKRVLGGTGRSTPLSPTAAAVAAHARPMGSPMPALPTDVRPGHSRHSTSASVEILQQQLNSVRQQLTTTIQLGFQAGRFKRLNIAILVVGTRGDVQPFLGIGLRLEEFGHRVRIASHSVYRDFVTSLGLEFYPLGGDPAVLSEYVVKHRGILPGWDIKDALAQKEQVRQILYSTWGACTAADPQHPNNPFLADALVANPPSYGVTHCAEALNVPLHVVFTMPWTPTKAFPQPFARIRTNMTGNNSKARELMNWMSYFAMEDLAWLGMAGMQKDFRQKVLGLNTWNKYCTSHAIYYSQVPVTYIWSPSLVQRPQDWPAHCEVVGFVNVELRKLTAYTPPKELEDFLAAGAAPVFIGFGSLVMDRPELLTSQILAALQRTGLRAIIQKGWGGLGAEYGKQKDGKPGKTAPQNVMFIDSVPHDWLFEHVCAVIHHGGAGTTAAGLLAGKPTFIVPFFGDQPFWGAACESAGVGPAPVPIDNLNTDRIVDALKELILPTRQQAAKALAERMKAEDGIAAAVDHIHRTIYTTLLGKKTPIWMTRREKEPHTGASPAPAPPPTSAIQEMETDAGEGFLQGILRLPMRVLRSVTASNRTSLVTQARGARTSANRGQPLSAHAEDGESVPPANMVTVAGPESQRCFFNFLRC